MGGEACPAPLRSTYKHNDDLCAGEGREGETRLPTMARSSSGIHDDEPRISSVYSSMIEINLLQ